MTKPLVHLIGAGPGDPGLMTAKGYDCLERADVVIYDYLANPRFLSHVRADAELIYVGKRGFSEHVTQDQINAIIVEKALEDGGKLVARLKGGDPFIFGRGGEEALALVEAGVPFEVVPGISSGYGAPAYAGIPVTHRGITTDMAFVTGHEDPTKAESDINWEHLATAVGTICFFMGIKNLPTISKRLIENGRDPKTPVALVRWGTTPRQEVLVGTVEDIAEKAAEANFKAPAITIVGDVVSLREKLKWFESKELFGHTVIVTRSRTQASELTDKLEELGVEALEFPTIRTIDPESFDDVDAAIGHVEDYDWIVLTSVNAVDAFFNRLIAQGRDIRSVANARFASVGPATSERLRSRGINPDYVPSEYKAEGVVEGFVERGVGAGVKVLIPRAADARDVIPDTLRERGAEVDVVHVYRTVMGQGEASVIERLVNGDVDVVTFTSSSTVKNFMSLLEAGLPQDVTVEQALEGVRFASIGPITSDTARELGLTVDIEAEEFTIPGLVESVRTLLA